MEVREFAASILFSTTLEEKLRAPGPLTDAAPGAPLATPESPERPRELRFGTRIAKFGFPSLHELESDSARGRLLHFFANHELLATELMALALLKFPAAPKPFRAGLLRTLLDEQTHTKMYLGRLGQLGATFGEYPVNGYFWRAISDMATPLDYVSRLSLTFEQANLDYSRLYADRFRTLGDGPSEKLMDRIYHDEIAHVGFGLEWFRQWKTAGHTDWEAYEAALPAPLSPSRAKGEPFNPAGRVAAGLDTDFIRRLHVYSRSKGRPPGVFHFNPHAESHIGQGPSFTPSRHQFALARDLETLPAFLCRRDDVVLVGQLPGTHYLSELKSAGFDLPEFETLTDGRLAPDSGLRTRKIGALRPWAWSPDSLRLLQPLIAMSTGPRPPEDAVWESRFKPLYSKATAVELLRELAASLAMPDWHCPEDQFGHHVTDLSEALPRIRAWRHAGAQRLVAKMPYGAAGSNMLRLWEAETTPAQIAWLERALQTGNGLILEPWLDRVLDFSFQFEVCEKRIRPVGLARMINDHRGQYQGSLQHPRFTTGLDAELTTLLTGEKGGRLGRLHAALAERLTPRLMAAGFHGPLGIDAFAYRDGDRLRIKPVVEINPRHTMGRLMLELMRHAAPGSSGRFELITPFSLKKVGAATFQEYADQASAALPLILAGDPKPRVAQGFLCLNDPAHAKVCLPVLTLSRAA